MTVWHLGRPLPAAPNYPVANAGWYPLHPGRISNYGVPNRPVMLCLHTPEEPADDYESTPEFFRQDPAVNGSVGGTHYYHDNDGDVYQMAMDSQTPNAQGVRSSGPNPNVRLPRPKWWDPKFVSYNACGLSTEIEGYAATIHQTMRIGGPQWKSLVHWCAYKCRQYNIPVDRDHIVAHGRLATDRTDPGAGFPWGALIDAIKTELGIVADRPASYTVVPGDTLGVIAIRLGVALDELARVNNITNPNLIRVGQVLVLPGAEKKPPPALPQTPAKHRELNVEEAYDAFSIARNVGIDKANSRILDAKLQATGEKSGEYEIHHLLVKRK